MPVRLLILMLIACSSCSTLQNYVEENQVNMVQRSEPLVGKNNLSSLLIVGTGDVVSRQFIDKAMEHFQQRLWLKQIPTTYFFVPGKDFTMENVTRKMQEAESERYRYVLLVNQESGATIIGRQNLVLLDLSLKLFEKDKDYAAWTSTLNLSGKVYHEEVYTKASGLLLLHLQANQLINP